MRGTARITNLERLSDVMYAATLKCRVYVRFNWKVAPKNRGGYERGHTRNGYVREVSFKAYYFKDFEKELYYLFEEEFIARNVTNVAPVQVAKKIHSTEDNLKAAIHQKLSFLDNTPYAIVYCEKKMINRAGQIFCTPKYIYINIRDIDSIKYKLTLLVVDDED